MIDILNGYFSNNIVDNFIFGKSLILLLFIAIICLLIYFIRKGVEKYITKSEASYPFKKIVSFFGCIPISSATFELLGTPNINVDLINSKK